MIRLEYTATEAGLRVAMRDASRSARLRFYAFSAALIVAVTLALVPLTWSNPALRIATLLLMGFGLLSTLWRARKVFERNLDEQLAGQPALLATTRLEADASGVTLTSAGAEATSNWTLIAGVESGRSGVLLRTGGTLFWFVPDSAFQTPAAKADFCKQVDAWRSAATAGPEPEPFAPGPQDRAFDVHLEVDDYVALSRFVTRAALAKRSWRPWLLPIYLVLISAAGGLLRGAGTAALGASAALLVALLLGYPRISSWFLPSQVRRLKRRYPARFPETGQQMVVGPEGVRLRSPIGRFETPWGSITRIEDDDRHLFLFLGTQSAFIVPKRYFEPDEIASLRSRWTGWLEHAPRRVGIPSGPKGAVQASHNPFEPPRV